MSAMTPMAKIWGIDLRRLVIALYLNSAGPRWYYSKNWGGRWRNTGSVFGERVVAKGRGFRFRLFGRTLEVIVWPRDASRSRGVPR